MATRKSLIFLPIIAAVFLSVAVISRAQGQCIPQFSISSPESVDMSNRPVWVHIDVTNTGSCEGSTTVYSVRPDGWYVDNFTTRTLQPGESDNSSIKIFALEPKSVTIQFLAEGASASETKIIIGGVAPEALVNAPAQKNETQPPVIAPAPNPAPITAPQEQPAVQQEPNETAAEQNQPGGSVTGLLTANPYAQMAIFVILVFGAGYLTARIKTEGFRYRFRRK